MVSLFIEYRCRSLGGRAGLLHDTFFLQDNFELLDGPHYVAGRYIAHTPDPEDPPAEMRLPSGYHNTRLKHGFLDTVAVKTFRGFHGGNGIGIMTEFIKLREHIYSQGFHGSPDGRRTRAMPADAGVQPFLFDNMQGFLKGIE
jgi:hypothetical protein